MKITPVFNNLNRVNFSSSRRTIYSTKEDGEFVLPTYNRNLSETDSFKSSAGVKMIVSNYTDFFRQDLPWAKFAKMIKRHFPQGKVNVYDFACSDGSEAYSLAITLLEQLGERKASRFFPIIASDVDSDVINIAKSGIIMATDDDIIEIARNLKDGNLNKYFKMTKMGKNKTLLSPKEILTKNVVFKQQSVLQGVEEINQDENNVILARNFWKYLSSDEISETTWRLKEKLNKKTLTAIGTFDQNKAKEVPYFLAALGLRSFDDKGRKNILSFDEQRKDKSIMQDYETWQAFVQKGYDVYIPKYLKH